MRLGVDKSILKSKELSGGFQGTKRDRRPLWVRKQQAKFQSRVGTAGAGAAPPRMVFISTCFP